MPETHLEFEKPIVELRKKLQELQEAGFKRINETICRTQGVTLEGWLEWSDRDEGDSRQ